MNLVLIVFRSPPCIVKSYTKRTKLRVETKKLAMLNETHGDAFRLPWEPWNMDGSVNYWLIDWLMKIGGFNQLNSWASWLMEDVQMFKCDILRYLLPSWDLKVNHEGHHSTYFVPCVSTKPVPYYKNYYSPEQLFKIGWFFTQCMEVNAKEAYFLFWTKKANK